MAQTKVVLLERIETLGNLGDVVAVKPGYARNYLLPQKKALRASKENIAYFEAQRKNIEAENEKRRKEAEKLAKKIEGMKVPLIRQAAEGGQLYGSVTARDIAAEVSATAKEKIERSMVQLNQNFKLIGLFPVTLLLHPEVKVEVIINIARSEDEAATQAKTGKALIVEEGQSARDEDEAEDQLAEVLDEAALEARKSEEDEKEGEEEAAVKKAKGKRKPEAEAAEAEEGEEAPEKKKAKKPANAKKDSE